MVYRTAEAAANWASTAWATGLVAATAAAPVAAIRFSRHFFFKIWRQKTLPTYRAAVP